ncbi:MAG: exodeoxyribonuclease VII small subunit [Bacteroidetes bacterium 47-18]|nr:MAG: exodeoxyribonuclease VII small subunit [Bacteroidetes bacterium 47-18]
MTEQFEFDDAYQELLRLVNEIESDNVALKDMAQKIAEARSLVQQCEQQLRTAEDAVERQEEQ